MLVPTGIGFQIYDWAAKKCPRVFDLALSQEMEEKLDLLEQGQFDWRELVREVHGRMGFEVFSYAEMVDKKKAKAREAMSSKERGGQLLSPKQLKVIKMHATPDLQAKVAAGDSSAGRMF